MQLLQISVFEGLLNSDSIIGIIGQHLLEKGDGIGVGSFEQLVKVFAFSLC
jgi:hypothetical protein